MICQFCETDIGDEFQYLQTKVNIEKCEYCIYYVMCLLGFSSTKKRINYFLLRRLGYERVSLPLHKVADTPFHIQGDDLLAPGRCTLVSSPVSLLAGDRPRRVGLLSARFLEIRRSSRWPGGITANAKHLYDICTMLDQRRRRWADVCLLWCDTGRPWGIMSGNDGEK